MRPVYHRRLAGDLFKTGTLAHETRSPPGRQSGRPLAGSSSPRRGIRCARSADACLEDDVNATTFTVFFEGPFWVGILEISDDDGMRAARHVFGEEPSGPELYAFGLSRDYDRLLRRALEGRPAPSRPPRPGAMNPKRAARAAAKERKAPAVSTAAQRAIRAALEQSKTEKRSQSRGQRLAEVARRRELARANAKARHRGR